MNKLELFVYGMVKNNYRLKNAIRNIYQGFFDLLPNRKSVFLSEPIVREGCFFGFHDVTPFSADNSRLLSNRLTIPLRMPTEEDVLEIGYWYGENYGKWQKISETTAWNYHKGCRLQWIGAERCIFNIATDGRLGARIVDLDSGEAREIGWAIDTASHDGRWGTSFSYERLQSMMPGYGYAYKDSDSCMDEQVPEGTGLFLIDLRNNTRRLLLDMKRIVEFENKAEMNHTFNFVTHTEFSADDRYISFLHRWYKGTFRRTRLIVYDLKEGRMYASPTSGMVSHYVWNDRNGIVAYCRVGGVDSHVYFHNPQMSGYNRCGYPQINSDGHQHFIDSENFVVDTYPDKWRHAKLYIVNVGTGDVRQIGDVRSYKKYESPNIHKHWRCDLHPRSSRDGTLISFDSVFTGVRSLCVMKNDGRNVEC